MESKLKESKKELEGMAEVEKSAEHQAGGARSVHKAPNVGMSKKSDIPSSQRVLIV